MEINIYFQAKQGVINEKLESSQAANFLIFKFQVPCVKFLVLCVKFKFMCQVQVSCVKFMFHLDLTRTIFSGLKQTLRQTQIQLIGAPHIQSMYKLNLCISVCLFFCLFPTRKFGPSRIQMKHQHLKLELDTKTRNLKHGTWKI